jgi:hypothetical protein
VALDPTATLVIGTGRFYTAPSAGQALPADLAAPTTPWVEVGNTSLDDIIAFSSEGGDATTLGTLQAKSLRTTYAPRVESFTINLQQFDQASLKLYYGSNASVVSGMVQVPASPTPTTCAFLAVFIDGANKFAIYAPKAEIFRADDLAVSDAESLVSLPLSVKPLVYSTNTWTYSVTALGS